MNWYRRNINLVGLVVVVLVAIAISLAAIWSLSEYEAATAEAEQARRTVEATASLLSDLKDAETGQRGFLLTHDEQYLGPYNSALPRIRVDLAALADPHGHSADPGTVAQLPPMVASMLDLLARTILDQRRGDIAQVTAAEYAAGKKSMDTIRALCERLNQTEQRRVNARTASISGRREAVRALILGGTAVILVLVGLFGVFVVHPLDLRGRDAGGVLASEATDRMQPMQALRETSDRLSTMVDTAPLAIWTLDRQGRVTSWNRMATEMFQWDPDETLGQRIEIVPEEKKAEFAALLLRYQSGDRVTGFQTIRRRRDGSLIHVTLWSAPLVDHANRQIGTLIIAADISQKKRDEETLARTEVGFRLLFENNPQPMWVFHVETLWFLEVNRAAIAHYGYSREEFLGMRASDLQTEEEAERFERAVRTGAAQTPQNVGTWKHILKGGQEVDIEVVAHELEFNGAPAILSVLTDVTEKRVLEEQLRQSQKLEAVGRLAGGVAHDFNNLLTVIIGYADLLHATIASDSPGRDAVDEIGKASTRASSLTRQLLAFSRKQVLQPKSLNLNQSVLKIQPMLSRLIGENIEIVTDLGTELWSVSADPGQVDQIIMNLAVNARDAMDEGGTLTIQTRNVLLGDEYVASHSGATQGANVLLSITDTGRGMDAETQSHIFEPFYTTKDQGQGTGLGLATVYGIVKQSGGGIWVYSELGLGTCIKVYLPRLVKDITEAESAPARADVRGTECILLVEDEESLRGLIKHLLEVGGYTVLAAATVDEALKICEDPLNRFDLLLTDIVLPRGNGWELAARAVEMRPQLRALLMSGYSEETVLKKPPFQSNRNFIQKPFNADALRSRIREILDDPQS